MEDGHGARSSGPRVLVVLGNLALNGQERGNIEVFFATKDVGIESLFVTHSDWGHLHLQPLLDGLGLRWTTLAYARHFTKRLTPRDWAVNLKRLCAASWGFWKIARRYRPTHVHVANPHYFLSVLPPLLLMRAPVVYRLGDEPTQHHLLYRLLWRWCIVPRVQTFVCVSGYVRAKAIEAGVPPSKTRVIYSYPPERPGGDDPPALPERFAGRTVTYVGQIARHKGVDLFVEAAAALCRAREDVRFLVAGTLARTNPFAVALFGRVQALGLAERIRFLGYVDDVPGLLAASDLHVCPSVWEEPLSNSVPEAKKAATPSVIFASGGLPELVEHGRDGFVCRDRTTEALEEGIAYFLDADDDMLRAASEEARASLERLGITKEAFAHAWLRVYRDVPASSLPAGEATA